MQFIFERSDHRSMVRMWSRYDVRQVIKFFLFIVSMQTTAHPWLSQQPTKRTRNYNPFDPNDDPNNSDYTETEGANSEGEPRRGSTNQVRPGYSDGGGGGGNQGRVGGSKPRPR